MKIDFSKAFSDILIYYPLKLRIKLSNLKKSSIRSRVNNVKKYLQISRICCKTYKNVKTALKFAFNSNIFHLWRETMKWLYDTVALAKKKKSLVIDLFFTLYISLSLNKMYIFNSINLWSQTRNINSLKYQHWSCVSTKTFGVWHSQATSLSCKWWQTLTTMVNYNVNVSW